MTIKLLFWSILIANVFFQINIDGANSIGDIIDYISLGANSITPRKTNTLKYSTIDSGDSSCTDERYKPSNFYIK